MEKSKIIKDFKYKGRRCVIIEIDRGGLGIDLPTSLRNVFKPYCNGYVELKESEVLDDYDKYPIESDEITYQGDLKFAQLDASDGKTYIGFDSAHYWNDEQPKSKTADYVANTCKKIVEELNKLKKEESI